MDKFVKVCLLLMITMVTVALSIGLWGYYISDKDFAGTDGIVEENAAGSTAQELQEYKGFSVPVPKQDWIAFAAAAAVAGFFFGYYWTKVVQK